MDYSMFRRKYLLRCSGKPPTGALKATVGNRVQHGYHFIHKGFCSFPLCSLAGYAQKQVSTYWTLKAKGRLRFEEHILFSLTVIAVLS